MDGEEIIEVVVVFALVVLPALAITVRLSLKPIVEAILRLHEGLTGSLPPARRDGGIEIEDLRKAVAALESKVDDLAKSEAFYRELRAGETGAGRVTEGEDA